MKRIVAVAGILAFSTLAHGAKQTINNGETMGQARTKINANFTEVYNGILIGDCTASPCYDGTTNSGTLIKLMGTDGVHWSSIQAGNVLADINWRLPLTLPGAGTTRLVNADEYGNMGLVDPASLGGGYTNLTSFVDQTAWRVFYSDGSGDVKELALGADGEYLKSNGASSAPTWATPTGAAHDAVTLDTETAAIFSLSTQQLTLDSQTANYVLAAPNGSAGDPTFRALVAADIPTVNAATALASNPTDCTTGQYATTIAANGNLTCSQVTYSQIGSTPTLGTSAQYDVGTSIGNIVRIADSGGNPALPFTLSLFDLTANAVSLDPPASTGAWMTFAASTGAMSYLTPGTGVATFLATPSSANLATAVTGETGSGALVFDTAPGFTTSANPVSADGATLGTTALEWSDIYLASGAVIYGENDQTNTITSSSTGFNFNLPLGLMSANDPDVAAEGKIAWDANGDVLRGYDGTRQVAVARVQKEIQVTVIKPQDLDDAQRDAFLVWSNNSGMSFVVTGWYAWSTSDDADLNIEETDGDGANNATVDAVSITTNGTSIYYANDSTITAGTIENGHLLWLDFDDTDAPAQVHVTIYGYFNADVN
jgi:hypothetical protein